MVSFKRKLTYTQIIALGFFCVVLLGGLLLCLPISSRAGQWTPFPNALFTSTSATCVTGLIVYDTCTHWSLFGQLVIITLIQIGGLGFMSVIAMFSVLLRRPISLSERRLLQQSAGSLKVGGMVQLIKRVAAGTAICEGAGAVLLAVRFCPEMGFWRGVYKAAFISVSAFCNAGFDVMGDKGPFSSLTGYAGDVLVNLTVMLLIIIGGIGFMAWEDIVVHKLKFRRYKLHTKIVLVSTAALLLSGTVLFFIFEYSHSLSGMSLGKKILCAAFQSVSPRTAGFNTVDLSSLSESGSLLTMILMLIGGSPGSTAGGVKTTTVVVLIMGVIAAARHCPSITVGKRRLDNEIAKQASAIVTIYLAAVLLFTMIICALEPVTLRQALFETSSAAGTAGLTMGITPSLGIVSKILLMLLMFGGRVGGLSLALVLAERRTNVPVDRPVEKILIG